MIQEICSAISLILGGETKVKLAVDPPPANLQTGELPAVWTFTGPNRESEYSPTLNIVRRTMRVQCAVIPTGQGDPNQREKLVRPVLEAVATKLRQYPSLGVNYIQKATVTGDSGVVVLPEYGRKFIGFEIQLEVMYFVRRSYAENE